MRDPMIDLLTREVANLTTLVQRLVQKLPDHQALTVEEARELLNIIAPPPPSIYTGRPPDIETKS